MTIAIPQNVFEPSSPFLENVTQYIKTLPAVLEIASWYTQKQCEAFEKDAQLTAAPPTVLEIASWYTEKLPLLLETPPHVMEALPQVMETPPQLMETPPQLMEALPQDIESMTPDEGLNEKLSVNSSFQKIMI